MQIALQQHYNKWYHSTVRYTRDAANNMQRQFQQAGHNAGRDFTNNVAKSVTAGSAKVEKAMNKAADATGRLRVEQAKLTDLQPKEPLR